jgi:hypothetical protein
VSWRSGVSTSRSSGDPRRKWGPDTHVFADLTGIDLLVVDGPPAPIAADIRYPSLPYFWNRLNAGGYVLLDDANREAERILIERWRATFPDLQSQFLPLEKGGMLLRKRKIAASQPDNALMS